MNKSLRTKVVDILLLCMIVLPFLFCMALKVLTTPASADISITGAQIYFTIPMPVMDLPITESQVTSLMVMISLLGLCLYMTHGIAVVPNSFVSILLNAIK